MLGYHAAFMNGGVEVETGTPDVLAPCAPIRSAPSSSGRYSFQGLR